MRFFTAAISSLFFVGVAFASPILVPIESYSGEKTGRHVVQLKDGAILPTVLEALKINPEYQWPNINGFAGKFDPVVLALIRASPDVEAISEDGIMHAMASTVQENAPWGLARISQKQNLAGSDPTLLGYRYRYDNSAGKDVDIYVVDTGVQVTHTEFNGRARWGKTFGGYADQDGNGHGTHCAGTAAGTTFGVAKAANIIAVKVLGDDGFGAYADIISGLDWVIDMAKASKCASVISMSLGGGAATTVDYAVSRCALAGVHVVVAAGNANEDAYNTSPARAPTAITVGATTINDARAVFSNYGAVVDVFAPGQDITSAWIGSNTNINTISGTSMATPHVSGLVAYLIALEGNKSPQKMSERVKALSQTGVISDIPSGTANLFAQNNLA